MDRPTDELSGGMKRKVFVAMALASSTEVMFLDEPTMGLDHISRLSIRHFIRSLTSQIMLTTHYVEEVTALSHEVILRPLKVKVRVEGTGDMEIGGIIICYVDQGRAMDYV